MHILKIELSIVIKLNYLARLIISVMMLAAVDLGDGKVMVIGWHRSVMSSRRPQTNRHWKSFTKVCVNPSLLNIYFTTLVVVP